MPTFQKVKLGDVVDFIDGDRGVNYPSQGEFFPSGYCLFLNTKNVPNSKFSFEEKMFITQEKDAVLRKGKLQRGDYVLTTRGTVGNFAYYDESVPYNNIRINSGMIILRKKTDELDEKFFRYYLSSPSFSGQVKSRATGSAQPQLPIKDMLSMEVILPDQKIQTHIASVLSAYDDLIENNEKRIKALEQMAQLLYTEWFIKFKFPGHEKTKFINSHTEYGPIPAGWEVKNLESVIKLEKGIEPGSNSYKNFRGDNSMRFFRVGDLNRQPSETYIEGDATKGVVCNGYDILVTFDGAAGVVGFGFEGSYSSGIRKIKYLDEDFNNPLFFYNYFRSEYVQNIIKSHAKGTTILHASGAIKNLRILFPSKKIFFESKNLFNTIFKELLNIKKQNQALSQTRDLLIPQLVTGKRELK